MEQKGVYLVLILFATEENTTFEFEYMLNYYPPSF